MVNKLCLQQWASGLVVWTRLIFMDNFFQKKFQNFLPKKIENRF
jgi:hypothetical protein